MAEFDPRLQALREHVADEVRRLDQLAQERMDRLEERFHAQQEAILKAEHNLKEELRGFPEQYALKVEYERIRDELAEIHKDHVRRSEYASLEAAIARIDGVLAQMTGRGLGITNLSDLVFKTIPILIAIISTIAAIYFATGR